MRVAAYQAPLLAAGSMDALDLIRSQIKRCESAGVSILCCPEAILGGLADNDTHPSRFAITANTGALEKALAPLSSDTVTSIVGFSELGEDRKLYNSAAVFERGKVAGVYRKLFPAIRHSVYSPGRQVAVFRSCELVFGIVICNDSRFPAPAKLIRSQGAAALFVPSNTALPRERASRALVDEARECDAARAVETGLWVIRADVAGVAGGLLAYGSSGVVDPEGNLVQAGRSMSADLVISDIDAERTYGLDRPRHRGGRCCTPRP